MIRPNLLIPHLIVPNITHLNYFHLAQKGFTHVIFDVDNTLTPPYKPYLHAPFKESWDSCIDVFSPNNVFLLSNSVGLKSYDPSGTIASSLEAQLGVKVIRHLLKKPRGGGLVKKLFGDDSKVIVVGDRVLTDIVFANLNGWFGILVDEIITEEGDNTMAKYLRKVERALVDRLVEAGYTSPLPYE